MNRMPVKSSDLKSVGYDEKTQTLEVEFHNRSIYRYKQVPSSLHKSLMNAHSHGEYFSKEIRKHPERYPYEKITPKQK